MTIDEIFFKEKVSENYTKDRREVMNELMTINQPITSMQIAEITRKEHYILMRDMG